MIRKETISERLGKAAALDIQNPETLHLVLLGADKGEGHLVKLIELDLLRMWKQVPGKAAFPNIRQAVSEMIGDARYIFMQPAGSKGLGEEPDFWSNFAKGLNPKQTTIQTGEGSKTVTEGGEGAGAVIGSILGAALNVGTAYYTNKLALEAEKEKLEMIQKVKAQEAAAAAKAQEAALLQQQAMILASESQKQQMAPSDGLPSWVIPVGIGALGIGVILFTRRK